MEPRKALLYKDYKKSELLETVTILHIGTACIAASVERESGEVIEVSHDRLKFIR